VQQVGETFPASIGSDTNKRTQQCHCPTYYSKRDFAFARRIASKTSTYLPCRWKGRSGRSIESPRVVLFAIHLRGLRAINRVYLIHKRTDRAEYAVKVFHVDLVRDKFQVS
jgi:hypothetical protein